MRAGLPARYRVWPFDADEPVRVAEVPAGGLVLVEGVSCLAMAVTRQVGTWWDLSIWLDAPFASRRARIERRDPPSVQEQWRTHWWPSEQRYFANERPDLRADLVVRG